MSLDSHPVVQEFNAFVAAGHELQDNLELTVRAYTVHSLHYGKTVNALISRYYVSPQDLAGQYARAISVHIKKRLLAEPQLLQVIAQDVSQLGRCLEDFRPAFNGGRMYDELCAAFQNGIIYDNETFYMYMATHHLDEMVSEGW